MGVSVIVGISFVFLKFDNCFLFCVLVIVLCSYNLVMVVCFYNM